MAFTQISSTNIANGAILPVQVSTAFEAEYAKVANLSNYSVIAEIANNLAPKINVVSYANSTYSVLDDTAANIGGGYLVITGTGFQSGAQVIIGTTPATSTTFVSSTELRAQVPAANAASYQLSVVNPDGGTGIKINGITYSGTPTWVTASTLANTQNATAFTGTFEATGATSYANTTALPSGFNLVSANGYYYGTIVTTNQTTYNFTISAIDNELQSSDRSFSLTTLVSNAPPTVEYIVVAGGGGGNRAPSPGGYGGGGGAGGVLTGNLAITTATTYTVTVGGGGTPAGNGANSLFDTITSFGGGYGGTNSIPGQNGGSGGGGSTSGGSYPAGKGIYPGSTFISATRQGYDGGTATPNYQGGGGGGAGATPADNITGGNGLSDSQLNNMLSATSTGVVSPSPGARYIAGGGGGGGGGGTYYGGLGGGGTGGNGLGSGTTSDGTTNTGSGGGGGNYGSPVQPSRYGGSGIVILRYASTYDAAASTTGTPTVTTSGGYRYYTFTGSGSITW